MVLRMTFCTSSLCWIPNALLSKPVGDKTNKFVFRIVGLELMVSVSLQIGVWDASEDEPLQIYSSPRTLHKEESTTDGDKVHIVTSILVRAKFIFNDHAFPKTRSSRSCPATVVQFSRNILWWRPLAIARYAVKSRGGYWKAQGKAISWDGWALHSEMATFHENQSWAKWNAEVDRKSFKRKSDTFSSASLLVESRFCVSVMQK